MRTRNRSLSASILTLALAMFPGAARAQPAGAKQEAMTDEVRAHLDKGRKLYDDGAHDAALVEFQRAYDLSGNYKILYNMAVISAYVKDFVSALQNYQAYLVSGSGELAVSRYVEVQKEIARLTGLVAKVELVTSAVGAEVQVDDVAVARTPLTSPLLLNPGKRRIALVRGSTEIARKLVVVAAGDSTRVELQEPKKPTAAAPTEAPRAEVRAVAPPEHGSSIWPFWGVTGGLAAGTAAMGILALTSHGALSDERDALGADLERLGDLSTRTEVFSLVADVLGGLTVVSAGISIYLSVRSSGDATSPVATWIELGPGRVSVRGSF